MSSKYDEILTNLLTRFSTDSEVEESTRRIVRDVINAEMNKLSLKTPHKILVEIKQIIEREAKQISSKT
ncbi:hypothetical protein ACFSQJ_03930 [Croceitalea marina]|uniref:Uncharacterized protein n=1 Tax=Croceitalea marina TaxID=1775166 RepID=A0ABW5MTM4_9FLAO